MANSSADYVQQAAHNTDLAEYLRANKTECLDWAVTCLFYAAVHYVNAYLVKAHIPIPRKHRAAPAEAARRPGRLNIVQQDPALSSIYRNYRHLDDESRDARYELRKPSPADYDNRLRPQLERIRNFILPKVTN
jgi:hypothetical protein